MLGMMKLLQICIYWTYSRVDRWEESFIELQAALIHIWERRQEVRVSIDRKLGFGYTGS